MQGRRRGDGRRSSRDAGSDAAIGVHLPGNGHQGEHDAYGVRAASFGDGDAGDGRAAAGGKPSAGSEFVARSDPGRTQGALGSDENGLD